MIPIPEGLKPFKVFYRKPDGEEASVVVYAYDTETAKSRAAHEGAIEDYKTITRAQETTREEMEKKEW